MSFRNMVKGVLYRDMLNNSLFENYQNQRWIFSSFDEDDVKNISTIFKISEVMAKVLIHNTGSTDVKTIQDILITQLLRAKMQMMLI